MATLQAKRTSPVSKKKVASNTRAKRPKEQSKMCVRCRQTKPISLFYGNKGWVSQASCDAWCKDCVQKHCKDVDTLREYCWYNNRLWSDDTWERALSSSTYRLATDENYISASKTKRKEMENEAACGHFMKIMNLKAFYVYSDNIGENNAYREYNADSIAGSVRV
jgi:hypothetical protein